MNLNCINIKNYLENAFDIPFVVESKNVDQKQTFIIYPKNEIKSLFQVEFHIKSGIRLNIDVKPQRYINTILEDMAKSDEDKKTLFKSYAHVLLEKRSTIKFIINKQEVNILESEKWPTEWFDFYCHITKSPIYILDEEIETDEQVLFFIENTFAMFLSLLTIIENDDIGILEGEKSRTEVNKYERNPLNRKLCILAYGYKCQICNFDFEKKYGLVGKHFIHVHHIIPVSKIGHAYKLDPEKDLIPVCPNCHAMLHRKDPPYQPDELKVILKND